MDKINKIIYDGSLDPVWPNGMTIKNSGYKLTGCTTDNDEITSVIDFGEILAVNIGTDSFWYNKRNNELSSYGYYVNAVIMHDNNIYEWYLIEKTIMVSNTKNLNDVSMYSYEYSENVDPMIHLIRYFRGKKQDLDLTRVNYGKDLLRNFPGIALEDHLSDLVIICK